MKRNINVNNEFFNDTATRVTGNVLTKTRDTKRDLRSLLENLPT